jgi:carboxyl-terminal processing protease
MTYARIARQLWRLRDSDLRLVSKAQGAAIQNETEGTRVGIGLVDFAIDMEPQSGEARVVTAIDDSPAARAGIRPRDVIVSIDGRPTAHMDHETVMDALRRDRVRLVLRRGQGTFAVSLQAKSKAVGALRFSNLRCGTTNAGYIRVAQFTPDIGGSVRYAVMQLQQHGVSGFVLDLRNNPGGLLASAEDVASVFAHGPLGRMVRRDGSSQVLESRDLPATSKPVAVLVNGGTASAAEFVAAAIRDRGRGRLLGTPTYGRRQAQVYLPLSDGYGLIVPSARLVGAKGHGLRSGVLQPDVLLNADVPQTGFGSAQDHQLESACESLKAKRKAPAS